MTAAFKEFSAKTVKQKTAYEMRESDWSSDVCSSDLLEKVLKNMITVKFIRPPVRKYQMENMYEKKYTVVRKKKGGTTVSYTHLALQKQAHVEYLLDVLLFGDTEEIASLITEHGKAVSYTHLIEVCQRDKVAMIDFLIILFFITSKS